MGINDETIDNLANQIVDLTDTLMEIRTELEKVHHQLKSINLYRLK